VCAEEEEGVHVDACIDVSDADMDDIDCAFVSTWLAAVAGCCVLLCCCYVGGLSMSGAARRGS